MRGLVVVRARALRSLAARRTRPARGGPIAFPARPRRASGRRRRVVVLDGTPLRTRAGRAYGFQLTFFRAARASPRALRLDRRRRAAVPLRGEDAPRRCPGIAGAAEEQPRRLQRGLVARRRAGGRPEALAASGRAGDLALTLTPGKPPVLHGRRRHSRTRGREPTSTRTTSRSRASRRGNDPTGGSSTEPLAGTAWFDHEWGPGVLPVGTPPAGTGSRCSSTTARS